MRGHPTSAPLAMFLSLAACLLGPCSNSLPTGKTGLLAYAGANAHKELANYYTVASILANGFHELDHDPERELNDEHLAQILARMQKDAMTLQTLRTADEELRFVANEASAALLDIRTHILKLQSMPQPPGGGEMFLEGLIRGFFFDLPGIIRRADEVTEQERAITNELRSLAASLTRLKAAQLLLPRIAAKYQNPSRFVAHPLTIDFSECWNNCDVQDDQLVLRNAPGTNLSNCTLLIELHGKNGDIVQNVHYVESWRAGHWLYTDYSTGRDLGGAIVGRETTTTPVQRIYVSLWSNEVKKERIEYIYAGKEKTKDIAWYCNEFLSFRASYRPFYAGILWNQYRGAHVLMSGMPTLRNVRVTITFRRGLTEEAYQWEVQRWEDGQTIAFETEELTWDPTSFTIDLSFPETDYVHHAGTWVVKE